MTYFEKLKDFGFFKILFFILFYFIITIYLSSLLVVFLFTNDFSNARFFDIYHLWYELQDVKGKRLIVYASMLFPHLPLIAILLSSRWSLEEIYGSARFATNKEIKKVGLRSKQGLILAKLSGDFIIDNGDGHVFLAAPTRSGKGVGFVIPNLLTWDQSCIVLDMKFENFDITSTYRKACGQKVFLFAPGQMNTHCFNPFDLIDRYDLARIDKLQTIAVLICPTPPKSDPMWSTEARNLLLAVSLYILDKGDYLSFTSILTFVQSVSSEDIENILVSDLQSSLDPICMRNFKSYTKMGDKQQGGINSELTSALSMFNNPLVAHATSKSDFDIRNLKKEKTTIYLGATPKTMLTLSSLFNLFFQFALSIHTEKLPDKSVEPHKILMLLDEFPAMGEMEIIKKGIGYFAGYGIRLAVIAQGESQIEDIYNQTGLRSFLTNFQNKIYFAPNDPKDAEAVASQLGTKTVQNISDSKPSIISGGNRSESHSKASRSLMLAQEVRLLDRKRLLLISEGINPIKADKVVYFKDRLFKDNFFNLEDRETSAKRKPILPPVISLSSSFNSSSTGDIVLDFDNDDLDNQLSEDEIDQFVDLYFDKNVDLK